APAGEAVGTAASAASACGDLREPCCGNDVCSGTLICDDSHPTTEALCRVGVGCGLEGQTCCPGRRCQAAPNCDNGVCKPWGATGQECCGIGTSSPCDPGNVCANGTCACGGLGQPCCGGNSCNGALLGCSNGTCIREGCPGPCCPPTSCKPGSP